MPCESSRSQNGATTNTCLRDSEKGTSDTTGYHDDAVPTTDGEDTTTDGEDMPSDAEFAALRDILPIDTGEGPTQGFPYSGEAGSIVPKDATPYMSLTRRLSFRTFSDICRISKAASSVCVKRI